MQLWEYAEFRWRRLGKQSAGAVRFTHGEPWEGIEDYWSTVQELAAEGWELVSHVSTEAPDANNANVSMSLFFKRPRQR